MSDQHSAIYPAPPTPYVGLDSEAVFAALSEGKRRAILKLLLERGAMGVQEVAAVLRRQETLIGRHLATLARTGLLEAVPAPDGDGRRQHYRIPPHVVGKDANGRAVLDYGCALVRV